VTVEDTESDDDEHFPEIVVVVVVVEVFGTPIKYEFITANCNGTPTPTMLFMVIPCGGEIDDIDVPRSRFLAATSASAIAIVACHLDIRCFCDGFTVLETVLMLTYDKEEEVQV
jgi:hypothetical protein